MKIRNVLNPVFLFENRSLIIPTLVTGSKKFLRSHGIPLTTNDRKVVALKNKHKGRRCFIIGSGPSLKNEDLDRLKDEVTFACNKIYLAFDSTEWRPTYYSVIDTLVAENNKPEIDALKLNKIFEQTIRPYFTEEQAIWLNSLDHTSAEERKFSTNALEGVYGGSSVLYFQMQLAFYMGIREIYLIGVDFSFDIPKSTGEICPSGEILKSQGEVNHFHPDYRKPGETWTMPLLDKQYMAFSAAKTAVESQRGKIFNASRSTKLDVFPLVNFDDIVA